MSFGSKHSRKQVAFTFNSDGIDSYITLKDVRATFGEHPQVIRKLWISKAGKYGDHPMITTGSYHVNLQSWMLEEVKAMMEDAEDVASINAGEAAFKVVEKTNAKGQKFLAVEWCDPE